MDDCQKSPYYRHEEVQYVSVEWSTYQRLTKQVEDVLTKNRKLKTDRKALLEALKDCAEILELSLGKLGCSVEANDGGGLGHHDADSFGGINALRSAREAIIAAEREN
jgi:hypothetical protein